MNDDIKRITQETCLALIPQFYDGVLEATRIQQVNDAIIEPFIAGIMRIHRNAYIQTMDADALSELENGLGIAPSGTIEQRRQGVIDALCDPHIVNDATLHELCQSLAPGFTVYEQTDPQALTLGIFTEEDDAQGHLPAVGIVDEIRPTVPQNLALYAGVDTTFDRPVIVSHAHFSALWAGLGTVERQVPRGMPVGGVLTATSDEVVEMEVPERMENGGIYFTGELRANIIPPSGVVEEYAPPIIMLLGVSYSGGNFTTNFVTDFSRFNATPTTQSDADTVTAFGLELNYAGTYGPYGAIQWSDNYEYEPLGVYLDINGDNEYTDVDVNGLYCMKNESAGYSVAMCSHNSYWGSQVMTWRCRITKK